MLVGGLLQEQRQREQLVTACTKGGVSPGTMTESAFGQEVNASGDCLICYAWRAGPGCEAIYARRLLWPNPTRVLGLGT